LGKLKEETVIDTEFVKIENIAEIVHSK